MGSLALGATWRDPRLDVVAVVGERPAADLASVVAAATGCEAPDVVIRGGGDIEGAIAAAGGADLVILATSATLSDLAAQISRAIALGLHSVCITEEALWPAAFEPDLAASLEREAVTAGKVVFGTGINPGFVMDVLPASVAAAVPDWTRIRVRRVNDLSRYGPSVFRDMGVGLAPEEFRRELEVGRLLAHKGFPASVATISSALGVELEIVENGCQPLVREIDTVIPGSRIPAGRVIGTDLHCRAVSPQGHEVVLEHPQLVGTVAGEEAAHDLLEIRGSREVSVSIPGGIRGAGGTVALMVNAALSVGRVDPGLRTIGSVAPATVLNETVGVESGVAL